MTMHKEDRVDDLETKTNQELLQIVNDEMGRYNARYLNALSPRLTEKGGIEMRYIGMGGAAPKSSR